MSTRLFSQSPLTFILLSSHLRNFLSLNYFKTLQKHQEGLFMSCRMTFKRYKCRSVFFFYCLAPFLWEGPALKSICTFFFLQCYIQVQAEALRKNVIIPHGRHVTRPTYILPSCSCRAGEAGHAVKSPLFEAIMSKLNIPPEQASQTLLWLISETEPVHTWATLGRTACSALGGYGSGVRSDLAGVTAKPRLKPS